MLPWEFIFLLKTLFLERASLRLHNCYWRKQLLLTMVDWLHISSNITQNISLLYFFIPYSWIHKYVVYCISMVWTFSLRHHAQQNINRKIQSSWTLTQIRNLSWWELTDSPSTSGTLWMCYLGDYLAVYQYQWFLKMIWIPSRT